MHRQSFFFFFFYNVWINIGFVGLYHVIELNKAKTFSRNTICGWIHLIKKLKEKFARNLKFSHFQLNAMMTENVSSPHNISDAAFS